MRELGAVLLAFAVIAAVSTFAVEVLHDRETVVPPPDAVAEQFAREVMAKRWEPAKVYLADPESRSQSELEELQQLLGEKENVEAEVVTRDDARAVVSVRVPETDAILNLGLAFDGEWKIE